MTTDQIADEEIVAFLDGQAPEDVCVRVSKAMAEDPAMLDRVAALQLETDQLQDGMDALLATAPAIPVPTAVVFATETQPSAWRSWRAVAAAALLFAAGMGAGWSLVPVERQNSWHQAVADYQVLYSTATLANLTMASDQRLLSLERTSADLGLTMTIDQVTVPGLEFQRAQILDFQGQPLAQLTYLDSEGNPIAFCLTRSEDDAVMASRMISGLNAVTWSKGGMGFILIGPASESTLSEAQTVLDAQIKI